MLAFFCSNKDFFKRPFIQRWLEKSGVCCYHGDSMAVTPETIFLTTFQTTQSVLTAVHTVHLYKLSLNYQLVIQWSIVMHNFGKLSSISPLSHTLWLMLDGECTLFNMSRETMHNTGMYSHACFTS